MLPKKAIFINTASQVIVRFITLAFTLISIKLLTNYLGTKGVGEYNTITTYINFFIVIADLGLFSVTVREVSKNPSKEKQILSNVLVIRTVATIIACFVAYMIVFFTKYDQSIKIGTLIATGFLFFNLMASVYDIALQYRLKMQYSALAEFLSKLITIIALYIIIKMHGNFYWVTSTIALSGFLIFIFKWIFTARFVKFSAQFDQRVAKWIFNLSWPLGLVFIVNNLFFKLDTLLLFVIKGASTVGIYTVAYKVLDVTTFIGFYFSSALKPVISENIGKDKEAIGAIMNKSFAVMLFIAAPISIVCIAFSKEIILFLSNSEFIAGSKALILLAFTLPFIYFDALQAEIFIANDERKLLIRISIFILLFNFLANLIIIPKYSFMGAASTTLLSEIVLFLINNYYTKKIINYSLPWMTGLKIVAVAALSLLVGFWLKHINIYFIFLIAVEVAAYFLLCYAFNILSYKSFKEMLKS